MEEMPSCHLSDLKKKRRGGMDEKIKVIMNIDVIT